MDYATGTSAGESGWGSQPEPGLGQSELGLGQSGPDWEMGFVWGVDDAINVGLANASPSCDSRQPP
jgi:hypothetical protein